MASRVIVARRLASMLFAFAALGIGRPAMGAEAFQPATFDLRAARRTDDLEVTDLPGSLRVTPQARVREVRFSSSMWAEGARRTIRIQAFVATPTARDASVPRNLPAVVIAHGLGAKADADDTVEIARNLGVVAISISAPGNGASEGDGPTADDARSIFRADADIRASWLYAYAYALLRAITYVGTLPEVDPKAIVVTGFSMGGLAAFVVGGVDDRIRGVLAVAASGGLARAAEADTWFRRLVLSAGGLKPSDPGPRAFFRHLDPLAFAARQHGAVYMLVGAQDEFFPLDQIIRTFKAVRAPAKSLEVIADYDHGWYFAAGCPASCMPGSGSIAAAAGALPPHRGAACPSSCPQVCPEGARPPYCGPQGSYNRQEDFSARRSLLLRALVSQHAARPARAFAPAPPTPFVQRVRDQVVVRVNMDPVPRVVRLAVSENSGYTFGQYALDRASDGAWHFRRQVSANAILIAEVETEDGATATSIPVLPRDYRQRVRPFGPSP
jgi:dienelactone hydrolase